MIMMIKQEKQYSLQIIIFVNILIQGMQEKVLIGPE